MSLLLVLEDTPADLRLAVDSAQHAGYAEFEVTGYATEARAYLEKAISRKVPRPDAMLIDLALGDESGFELLRFWHSTPKIKGIPVVVWSLVSDTQRETCLFFGVSRFVSKEDDPNVLREALSSIIDGSGESRG